MCGLYGYYATHPGDKVLQLSKNVLEVLALANEGRGNESTGLGLIYKERSKIIKNTLPASKFLLTKRVKKALKTPPHIVIGHTRLATTGPVRPSCAHPFEYGAVIGAHNGHVSNWLKNTPATALVDSEAIFYRLNRAKPDDKYAKQALEKLFGLITAVWYDWRVRKLRMVAEGYALYLAWIPKFQTFFWSSEDAPLDYLLDELKLEGKVVQVPKGNIITLNRDGGFTAAPVNITSFDYDSWVSRDRGSYPHYGFNYLSGRYDDDYVDGEYLFVGPEGGPKRAIRVSRPDPKVTEIKRGNPRLHSLTQGTAALKLTNPHIEAHFDAATGNLDIDEYTNCPTCVLEWAESEGASKQPETLV